MRTMAYLHACVRLCELVWERARDRVCVCVCACVAGCTKLCFARSFSETALQPTTIQSYSMFQYVPMDVVTCYWQPSTLVWDCFARGVELSDLHLQQGYVDAGR